MHGVDNNQRAVFFGPEGDTRWNQERLRESAGYVHHELDIRDREGVLALMEEVRPSLIVHTAAQPSHDRAAAIPFVDFDVNAVGTLQPAGSGAAVLPGVAVHSHVDQQGLWRPAQPIAAARNSKRAGITPTRPIEHGIPEDFSIDQ